MKFVGIRKKLINFTTRILLGTLAVTQLTASTLVIIRTYNTFMTIEEKIEKNMIDRGKILVINNSIALRTMTEEYAFTNVRELVVSTLQRDPDMLFGIFMDHQRRPWVIANSDHPDGLLDSIGIEDDSMSLWADTISEVSFKPIRLNGMEVLEFAAPIISAGKRLGTIRYGIATTSTREAISSSKRQFTFEIIRLTIIIILIGILLFIYESNAARSQADAITRPLHELASAVNTISTGNYNIPVTTVTNDEIGLLANSFETMRQTIKQYTVNLELMVQERTQQLNASLHEQLIQANKLVTLGTLVAGVAHEINNPNNSILLTSGTLEEMWKELTPVFDRYVREHGDFRVGGYVYSELRDEMPQIFGRIINNSRRIKHIVEDLKNYSRKDTTEFNTNLDINTVVSDSISIIENEIKKLTSNFVVCFGKNMPRIKGVHRRLEQVFVNLIQNACQALKKTTDGVYIETEFDPARNKIIVSIRDEGTGMSPEILQHMFTSFFTTKQDSGGTGLGLAVSQRIIKDHDGVLEVESEPGKGTIARVMLNVW
jgi:signal transduction histidine kinase